MIIVGGGVAGLSCALGLARSGHDVTVLDPDGLTVASSPDEAFGLERRGAPQVRHTHGLLARLTTTLRHHFPDVLEALVGAGGVEVDLARRFSGDDEGDEQLRVLLARRTTLEWALRRAAAAEPGLTLRGGHRVASLVGGDGAVNGVELASGEVLESGTVVAAGGARLDVVKWLAGVGVAIDQEDHQSGIVYLTRWYRTVDASDRTMGGEDLVKLGGDLGYLFYLAVPADLGTFSLTMAIGADDDLLRSRLLDPESFERAAAALPLPAGILDRLVPDGPVHPMGGLVNRLRRFTDAGGRPLVTGFHATGDAHTCTNPIYGRGCSLALVQAVALADAVAAHPTDALARAEAYEAACREQTEPWYHLSVQTDRSRQARARRDRVGESAPDDRSANAIDRLFELGSDDPVVGRAILKAVNVLATPQQLMSDPAIVARVMELAAANGDGSAVMSDNRWLRQGPTHQEMIDLTKGSTTYA